MNALRPWLAAVVLAIGVTSVMARPSASRSASPHPRLIATPIENSRASLSARTAAVRATSTPPLVDGDVVLRAAWGSGAAELGHRLPSEGAPEVPMSFALLRNGSIAVLDQVNARISVWADGRPVGAFALPSETYEDIDITPSGKIVVLDRLATATVLILSAAGMVEHAIPVGKVGNAEPGAITGIFARPSGIWVELEHGALVRIADAAGEPDRDQPAVLGRPDASETSLTSAALSPPDGLTLRRAPTQAGGSVMESRLAFPLPTVAIRALDFDDAGHVFLAVHQRREDTKPPYDVIEERETIVGLTADGVERGRFDIDAAEGAEPPLRAVRVAPDGSVHVLRCAESGVTIRRYAP